MVDLRELEYPRMLYKGKGIKTWLRVDDADQAALEMADGWMLVPDMADEAPEVDAETVKRGPGRPRKQL